MRKNYESGHILHAHVSAVHPFLATGHQHFASIVQKLWPFYSECLHFFIQDSMEKLEIPHRPSSLVTR